MKQFLERASILALSLVLITSFSISSALPAMFDYYQGYSKEQIELLVSLPSFGIMMMLLLNGFLEKIFPERLQISLGLLILSLSGTAPLVPSLSLCLWNTASLWFGSWDDQCQGHFYYQ